MRFFTAAALSCCTTVVKCFEQEIGILLILQMSKQKDRQERIDSSSRSAARPEGRIAVAYLPPPGAQATMFPPRIFPLPALMGPRFSKLVCFLSFFLLMCGCSANEILRQCRCPVLPKPQAGLLAGPWAAEPNGSVLLQALLLALRCSLHPSSVVL